MANVGRGVGELSIWFLGGGGIISVDTSACSPLFLQPSFRLSMYLCQLLSDL